MNGIGIRSTRAPVPHCSTSHNGHSGRDGQTAADGQGGPLYLTGMLRHDGCKYMKNDKTEGRVSMAKLALRAEPGAGHPFLCFLNTVTDDGKSRRQNSFADGKELQGQLQADGLPIAGDIGDDQMQALMHLREAAYGVFSALAAGRAPGRTDSQAVSSALRSTMSEADLQITPTGLLTVPGPRARPHDLLVLSMEDLLRSDRFSRLRECRRCTHLFLDQGRGVGRRWCSMSRCGNRAKAENFRARQRDAA